MVCDELLYSNYYLLSVIVYILFCEKLSSKSHMHIVCFLTSVHSAGASNIAVLHDSHSSIDVCKGDDPVEHLQEIIIGYSAYVRKRGPS